jgi:ubiquinone/menaquinone biosynthesis C-methylase UbiE
VSPFSGESMYCDSIQSLITPYAPALPLDDLVTELNRLYHSFEAQTYDQRHPEVHQQLPPIWSQMIQCLPARHAKLQWRVLDFGCGTGFEATQLVNGLGAGSIASLTCYDPSGEMLALCEKKLASRLKDVRFVSDLAEVVRPGNSYDLLLTNSLLHHLPSPGKELQRLLPVLSVDAWWLMGHEPSRRYHRNGNCAALLARYRAERKLGQLMRMREIGRKLKSMLGQSATPAQATANAAYQAGLFARRPSAFAIGRLVDFHVPLSNKEAQAGGGFDFEAMDAVVSCGWARQWVKTYSFMGPYAEATLSPKWLDRCRRIAAENPFDGANFCSVWCRK